MILKDQKYQDGWCCFSVSTPFCCSSLSFYSGICYPLMIIRCFQQVADGESITLHHHWVSMDKISPHMPVAVMASEDARSSPFMGFDFNAIESAAKNNARGGKVHGVSTISQQTAKNVFLWPGRS